MKTSLTIEVKIDVALVIRALAWLAFSIFFIIKSL